MFGNKAEESEIVFRTTESPTDHPSPVPQSPPGSPSGSADLQYEDVLDMVQRLHKELGLITLDNDKIRTVCNQLLKDNQARDRVIGDLTGLVERSLDRPAAQLSRPDAAQGHPIIEPDLIDNEGNLPRRRHWDNLGGLRHLPSLSPGCWTGSCKDTGATASVYFDSISTGTRICGMRRPRQSLG